MTIDSIVNGIVIDHIKAGGSMELYKLLKLDELKCSVAIIKNVTSRKMGKKDIIKIDEMIDINLEVLGFIDPGITVNIIKDGNLVNKCHLELPTKLVNVISCKNPRCITSEDKNIDQIFKLTDADKKIYRCMYCETKAGE